MPNAEKVLELMNLKDGTGDFVKIKARKKFHSNWQHSNYF
jgi:hypothetical protein